MEGWGGGIKALSDMSAKNVLFGRLPLENSFNYIRNILEPNNTSHNMADSKIAKPMIQLARTNILAKEDGSYSNEGNTQKQ